MGYCTAPGTGTVCPSVFSAQPSGLCAVVKTADPENSWKEGKTDGESQAQELKKQGGGKSEVG